MTTRARLVVSSTLAFVTGVAVMVGCLLVALGR